MIQHETISASHGRRSFSKFSLWGTVLVSHFLVPVGDSDSLSLIWVGSPCPLSSWMGLLIMVFLMLKPESICICRGIRSDRFCTSWWRSLRLSLLHQFDTTSLQNIQCCKCNKKNNKIINVQVSNCPKGVI